MKEISVTEYAKVSGQKKTVLLDVRTPAEFAYANIGGVNIPLDELDQRLSELNTEDDIYCFCHHGIRSYHACLYLSSLGYKTVTNIIGGIEAWTNQVDPSVPMY